MNQMTLDVPHHTDPILPHEAAASSMIIAIPVNELAQSILEIKLWRTDWMD